MGDEALVLHSVFAAVQPGQVFVDGVQAHTNQVLHWWRGIDHMMSLPKRTEMVLSSAETDADRLGTGFTVFVMMPSQRASSVMRPYVRSKASGG